MLSIYFFVKLLVESPIRRREPTTTLSTGCHPGQERCSEHQDSLSRRDRQTKCSTLLSTFVPTAPGGNVFDPRLEGDHHLLHKRRVEACALYRSSIILPELSHNHLVWPPLYIFQQILQEIVPGSSRARVFYCRLSALAVSR